jgi:hypothetical protein
LCCYFAGVFLRCCTMKIAINDIVVINHVVCWTSYVRVMDVQGFQY